MIIIDLLNNKVLLIFIIINNKYKIRKIDFWLKNQWILNYKKNLDIIIVR